MKFLFIRLNLPLITVCMPYQDKERRNHYSREISNNHPRAGKKMLASLLRGKKAVDNQARRKGTTVVKTRDKVGL